MCKWRNVLSGPKDPETELGLFLDNFSCGADRYVPGFILNGKH
jgi:hypothetical protein